MECTSNTNVRRDLVYGGSQSIFLAALYSSQHYLVLYKSATNFLGNRSPFNENLRSHFYFQKDCVQSFLAPKTSKIMSNSFPTSTMTSADFFAHRKRIYSKTSPANCIFFIHQKNDFLKVFMIHLIHSIPAVST